MFNLYGLGPQRNCHIENSTLYVEDLFTDRIDKFPIKETEFFKQHPIIKDTHSAVCIYDTVMWMIEDEEHNYIIGRVDGSVSVIHDLRLISCTSWELTELIGCYCAVGFYRVLGKIYEVMLDLRDNRTVYVKGYRAYARLVTEIPSIDIEAINGLTATALHNANADVEATDAYYLFNWKPDAGIEKKYTFNLAKPETLPVRDML